MDLVERSTGIMIYWMEMVGDLRNNHLTQEEINRIKGI